MNIITEYKEEDFIKTNYGDKNKALIKAKESLRIYLGKRSLHPVCRSRARSLIRIVRSLSNQTRLTPGA